MSALGNYRGSAGAYDKRIAALIAGGGRQMCVYDLEDINTVFQDAAGTVPGALEQPVELVLDRFGTGNNLVQVTSPARPTLSARANQMINSELWNLLPGNDGSAFITQEFSDIPSFLNTTSVSRVTKSDNARSNLYQYQVSRPITQGVKNTASFFLKPISGCSQIWGHTSTGDTFYFNYNVLSKEIVHGVNTESAFVDEYPDGWLRFSVTQKDPEPGSSRIFTIVAISPPGQPGVFLTTGYDRRPFTKRHLPYQRVNTASDYDAVNFPRYLRLEGADDCMATVGNVNFTGVTQLTVIAVVEADLDRGSIGFVVNHNSTGNSAFGLMVPYNIGSLAFSGSITSASAVEPQVPSYLAKSIITGQRNGKDAGTIMTLRRNGLVKDSVSVYGWGLTNGILEVGRQTSTAARYFKGEIYSLTVVAGLFSESELNLLEYYLSARARLAL